MTQGAAVTKSFVIDAIDNKTRLVTLRGDAGTEIIYCGPGAAL